MNRFSYTPMRGAPYFYFAIFGVLAVAGAFLIVTSVRSAKGPGVPFDVLWILILLWNAYWWLWRLSYRLEVRNGILRWTSPLRHGEIPTSGVVAVRSMRLVPQISVIEVRDRPNVLVYTVRGFSEFATALVGGRPIPIRKSFMERLNGRGRSAFECEP